MSTEDFMVVTFEPTGEVHAMHRDDFDLGFLGKQSITRASEIVFNEETQKWDVYLPLGEVHGAMAEGTTEAAQGFDGYNEARKFEVLWLEHAALHNVPPLGEAGRKLARDLRDGADIPHPVLVQRGPMVRGLDDIFWPRFK